MQIHLANTTETLELETSSTSAIHYKVGYTDITSSGVSNPSVNRGIISSATTTTILSAPAASTTRKVQYLNLYNAGTSSNILKIKEDVSGTENISFSISLQASETLRIVNDKVEVLDVSGRVKLQNSGDTEITGESRSIYKVGTAPEAAGNFYCFAKDSGFPGAWSPGTPGLAGRVCDSNTGDAGSISVGNPASGNWYLRNLTVGTTQPSKVSILDFLWVNTGIVITTTTAQTINSVTLPARDNNGTTNGEGVQVGILVTTATTNASAVTNTTMSYTNSDGTAGRTATISSFPATAVIGTLVKFQLQAGDKGVRSIQSITLGTSYSAGAISLVAFEQLVSAPSLLANAGSMAYTNRLDVKLFNGHCLIPIIQANGTTATTIDGDIILCHSTQME
jgi:hypothetical protein